MTVKPIHELGVNELAEAFRAGQITPLQASEHLLARIEDGAVNCNAFAQVDRGGALDAARASTQRWRNGAALGALDGVPYAVKDVLDVAGMPTRFGAAACADAAPAERDSLVVQRLRAAGAVLLGKTRTWEFAWRSNPLRDPAEIVRNPHDPQRSPGGSSSGSAAAVGAGLCPLALGTDSGGSVRGPAAFCGIVGLKPSHALIPVYPPSPMGDLEHIGLFTRSAGDLRSVLDVAGGRHSDDPASWPYRLPLPGDTTDLSSLRFGCSCDLNYANPSAALRAHFARVLDSLRGAGLTIAELDIPFPPDFERCYELFVPDAALVLELAPVQRRDRVDPEIVALAERAGRMTVKEYLQVEKVRDHTQRVFAGLFDDLDCLLTLTQETTANRLDEAPGIMKLTRCFNITGQAAISIPCGVSKAGLPIGLQLVCDRGNDGLLLAIAEQVQQCLAAR